MKVLGKKKIEWTETNLPDTTRCDAILYDETRSGTAILNEPYHTYLT